MAVEKLTEKERIQRDWREAMRKVVDVQLDLEGFVGDDPVQVRTLDRIDEALMKLQGNVQKLIRSMPNE